MAASQEPEYDEDELLDRSTTLARLHRKRLAPSRWRDLLAAGRGAKPPKEPEPWECCGSSCKPCVLELYREEKKVWEEVHPDGVSDDEGEEDDDGDNASRSTKAREADAPVEKVDLTEIPDAERRRATPVIEIELEKLALRDGKVNVQTEG
ncbi:hypothetical protein JCM3770_006985 [Rhodotorula araucariae]